ncbi:MAG TPA: ABC transporter permease subunit [Firmicutes bacterium]|nr:ABC transporter permease subunit [Candidatus Fermentithermobacillaceae bacterium]
MGKAFEGSDRSCDGEKGRTSARRIGVADLLALGLVAALGWVVASSHRGIESIASSLPPGAITLSIASLPYYVFRSILRMILAFGLSVIFTLIYGYVAGHYRVAEMVLIPILDILQSVPVLGFLSVSVASFVNLFPGSNLGFELASVFAIFTSQAWNMTFGFYQSLSAVPKDLKEAAAVFGLGRWRTFTKLELPYSMIGLVWNGMMSFGGGWFFLAASEAITVLGKDVRLPGIGSYMATAIEESNVAALMSSLVTMAIIIVLSDQLIWRPLVAWSDKFKLELAGGVDESESLVLDLFKRSFVLDNLGRLTQPVVRGVSWLAGNATVFITRSLREMGPSRQRFVRWLWNATVVLAKGFLALFLAYGLYSGVQGLVFLLRTAHLKLVVDAFYLGFLTFLRVMASVFLGMLWTVPVGVKIGTNPRLRKVAQPIVQIAASFPANMLFPFVTMLYVRYKVNFELGAVPLMMLGTQWYLLFNVIGGTMSIPRDLDEAARVYRLRGFARWKYFILPAIFPSVVTGAVTAAGGAWNASIVAEVTSWGATRLEATGLGAFIAESTSKGDWTAIVTGIAVMSIIVVVVNRFFWRKLYEKAEEMKAAF